MAKQWTVVASVNGGQQQTKQVLTKNDETNIFSAAFLFRVWHEFGLAQGDAFELVSVAAPQNANDPMGGFLTVPGLLIIAAGIGQISIAFID